MFPSDLEQYHSIAVSAAKLHGAQFERIIQKKSIP